VDFGIATLMGDAALKQRVTVEGWIVGTPAYMAPERFRNQPVEGRADVYSAGVTLFQMLTGRVPFESDQSDPMAVAMQHVQTPPPALSALRPEVPPAVEAAVWHALRKRPSERPTARELAAALRRAI
jgi:serine/threonine protein kinase